jgi:hypothetical protein
VTQLAVPINAALAAINPINAARRQISPDNTLTCFIVYLVFRLRPVYGGLSPLRRVNQKIDIIEQSGQSKNRHNRTIGSIEQSVNRKIGLIESIGQSKNRLNRTIGSIEQSVNRKIGLIESIGQSKNRNV